MCRGKITEGERERAGERGAREGRAERIGQGMGIVRGGTEGREDKEGRRSVKGCRPYLRAMGGLRRTIRGLRLMPHISWNKIKRKVLLIGPTIIVPVSLKAQVEVSTK